MTAVRIIREDRRYREREKQNVQIETEKKSCRKKENPQQTQTDIKTNTIEIILTEKER